LRVLDQRDLDAAVRLCEHDVPANLMVAARLYSHGVGRRAGGGELWGYCEGGTLTSLCWSGANLIPVEATEGALESFAARARKNGRQCSSIVGPSDQVLGLWRLLEGSWGRAREVRPKQPLMVIDSPPLIAPDRAVRRSGLDELDLVLPACVAMFTEEVGYSPVAADGGAVYRSQVTGLVAAGRSFVRVDTGTGQPTVVFKAELGSVTPRAVQVQGVWVAPRLRGQGLAAPGMAAVVEAVQAQVAPVVSLYVNDFNVRAVRAYKQVGFAEVGTFATVLF
jgi:predicted GNAT family acetyltransferase